MNYWDIGQKFCQEINALLETFSYPSALVTGGGFAYQSIKYRDDNYVGDYDFMIVYDDENHLKELIKLLSLSNFSFSLDYLVDDLKLLDRKQIDIIRLSGSYEGIKSTINLVPKRLIEDISELNSDIVIKKIAHQRNTSLFYSYGSSNVRIPVYFVSPSYVTDNGEDHYIHLDFSSIRQNNNIYFGILSDAVLKGFNTQFDSIGFNKLRNKMISNIYDFFIKNGIDANNYLNMFSNNQYFSSWVKEYLKKEFFSKGTFNYNKLHKQQESSKPIILTTKSDVIQGNPFNFINNKPFLISFSNYISSMQNTEYERQYLLDALGKFLGYLLNSNLPQKSNSNDICDNIIDQINVYGKNDLYFSDYAKYSLEQIMDFLLRDIMGYNGYLNEILKNEYIKMLFEFMRKYTSLSIDNLAIKYGIDLKKLYSLPLDQKKINGNVLLNIRDFSSIGTYHNYSSKVMVNYTKEEVEFLIKLFSDKNANILDVMCGRGRIANRLAENGFKNVYGFDLLEYNFLNVPKDFRFCVSDLKDFDSSLRFKYLYSLYNCFSSTEDFKFLLDKMTLFSAENSLMIVDVFNKEWRDSIPADFYKLLYDDICKLEIFREYSSSSGIEKTSYVRTFEDKTDVFDFEQHFFTDDEVMDSIDQNRWNIDINCSRQIGSRTNDQKKIILLRSK